MLKKLTIALLLASAATAAYAACTTSTIMIDGRILTCTAHMLLGRQLHDQLLLTMSWYPPDYEEPKVPYDLDESLGGWLMYRNRVKKWEEQERARMEEELGEGQADEQHPTSDVPVHPIEPDEHQ